MSPRKRAVPLARFLTRFDSLEDRLVPATVFVDAARAGQQTQDGTSWATAFAYLTDGLAAATPGDEVWVAHCNYRPDQSLASPSGTLSRAATFVVLDGISLIGGFTGTETVIGQRPGDPDPNTVNPATDTVLNGDLLSDDGGNFANYTDNVQHVVTAVGVEGGVTVDGVTILGAYNDNINGYGGGLNNLGILTLTNSTLTANLALALSGASGAALFNPVVATVSGCTFLSNGAWDAGGAIASMPGSVLTLDSSTFIGNTGRVGGAAFLSRSDGNYSVTNCTFVGGSGEIGNNEIYNHYTNAAVTNCTFATAGIVNEAGTPTITNTIVWGGGITNTFGGAATVTNSVIPGGTGTNIGADPLLGPIGLYGGPTQTIPLLPGSSAINMGTATGAPQVDQRGLGRVGATDIGAFESQGFTVTSASGPIRRR